MDLTDPRFDALLARLELHRKVHLLTGRDFWSTWPLEEIGLRSMVLSDGPSGVRGPVWDERSPSLNLPSASALSSSWDPQLAREYGRAAAAEARRKGVDVVLGPTINLHRSPLGGRHFEAFSEDPGLTAELAAAYVEGVQGAGVAATLKHYVANDFETERFTADVRVSDRALRELYLAAFERAVVEAGAWVVMSAYNGVNGATMSENDLLASPLTDEWGFDGIVVSDWTAVRSLNSARFAQDLAMPGPDGPWGAALVAAIEAGEIDEAVIDRKVRRLLLLAARVGALEGFAPPPTEIVDATDGPAFARRAAAAGMVLLSNAELLPLARPDAQPPARIAVIGHNALVARSQGGGSATVVPERVVSPLEGIRAAFPGAQVDHAIGAVVQSGVADVPLAELRNPVTGERGVRLRLLGDGDALLLEEDRFACSLVWLGSDAPIRRTRRLEVHTVWTPSSTGTVRLGFAGVGHCLIRANGKPVVDEAAAAVGTDLAAALLAPPSRSGELETTAGEPIELTLSYTPDRAGTPIADAMSFAFGLAADDRDPDALVAEAVELAAAADVVVLVVGTNSAVESEGFDRADLRLPGEQDRLAEAVLAANPATVVVVNAGAPVELPWADRAGATLLTWFGGQEYGHALGDVLTGAAEPGGRLPTTWPVRTTDLPVSQVAPRDGILPYDEDIHIGYRAWLRAGREPAHWFGAGASYTTFEVGEPRLAAAHVRPGGQVSLTVAVRNTGARTGTHVVQLYAARAESTVDRPVRWLVGSAVVRLAPGETGDAAITIPTRAFAHWTAAGWAHEAGVFSLAVGADAGHLGPAVEVELTS